MRLRATKLSAIGFGGSRAALPSLDLAFALDKTLTARKGPTPAFTRGSGATRVNAAGLIEYAPENLILSSNNIASPAWTKEGGTAASSIETVNGLTASVFNEDSANTNHRFYRVVTGLAGISSTFSVWLKAAGRRYVCVNIGSNGPNAFSKLVLDLVDQVVIVSSAGVTVNIQPEANGWARYSFTYAPRADAGTIPIQSNFSSTALSETGVGLNGAAFYVAGQQYERFPSARAYLLTTTDAAYSPRFDHDPVTLACKGLLIEEQRQNLFRHSENLNDAVWTKIGVSISANNTASPDGSITADKIVENTANTLHGAIAGSSVATNTTYIGSIYVKASERSFALIYTDAGGGNGRYISIPVDGSGQVLGAFNANSSTVTLQYVGNGWYRATIVINTGAKASITLEVYPSTNGTSASYLGNGTSGIFAWGAQLELGSFPTSYIPTTTAALTRSADVCSITGANFTNIYNNSSGTFISDSMIANLIGDNRGIAQIDSGTSDNVIRHQYSSSIGGFNTLLRANVDTPTILSAATGAVSTIQKRATAYVGTSFTSATNGGSVTTATRTFPVGLNTLRIGSISAGSLVLNGHIARIQYFKKRLPNAKLQSLTTP